ncbi:hypothetical protein TeGR_g3200, partial [Tetraparma gracilis]
PPPPQPNRRQDTGVGDEEEEVQMSFDDLPTSTQRKLQAFLFGAKKAAPKKAKKQAAKQSPVADSAPAPPSFSSAPAPAAPEADAFTFNEDLSGFDDEAAPADGMDQSADAWAAPVTAPVPAAAPAEDADMWSNAANAAAGQQQLMASQAQREAALLQEQQQSQ